MSRLYVYKIRYDDGTAPCVENGLLSLALCKPAIRATAELGDTLVGFAAKSMCADQRLVYAAVVTAKVGAGTYYRDRAFSRRRDCVYIWRNGVFHPRRDTVVTITNDDIANDLGAAPEYKRANVLLSENYRYFAETRAADYREDFPALARMIDTLGQGHRIHHGDRVRDALERYLARLWTKTASVHVRWKKPSRGSS